MSNLVERLSKGKHSIALSRYQTVAELKQAVEREFVLVKFTETNGGTEIGFKLDKDKSKTDFDDPGVPVRLVGKLNLDYHSVECSVDVDPGELAGTGFLKLL